MFSYFPWYCVPCFFNLHEQILDSSGLSLSFLDSAEIEEFVS